MTRPEKKQAHRLPAVYRFVTVSVGMVFCLLLSGLLWMAPSAHAALPDIDNTGVYYIEAENYTNMGAPNPYAWEIQNFVSGYFDDGTSPQGYLYTTTGGTNASPQGSRTDYPVNFVTGDTYYIWVRAMDESGSGGGDSTFWGVDGSMVGALSETTDNIWTWTNNEHYPNNSASITAGAHTLNLWPREAGQKTDGFIISADPNPCGLSDGNTSFDPYNPGACTVTIIDPTSDSASGYLDIPSGQSVYGSALDVVASKVDDNDLVYDTDLAGTRTWRALGGESDGFNSVGSADSKWSKTDVGGDATPDPSVSNGLLYLTGSGQDIWNQKDYFSYLYQDGKSGDFTLDVYVNSIENTHSWAKAGIMVRQSLASTSMHAMIVVTPGNGVSFQRRTSDGASSNSTTTSAITAPVWLRLVRSGTTYTGYYSNDGVNWTSVGSDTVSMSDPVIVGLPVTSHDSAQDCDAVFDNFMFMPSGKSGMATTWSGTGTAIDTTTGWSTGDYGLAMRDDSTAPDTFATNTFYWDECTDPDPSTITIANGQTVKGTSVSLPALYEYTGDVGSFSYQINGAAVTSPWNSTNYGTSAPQDVTFKVVGTDPDCGRTVSASNTITVDNTCSDGTPSSITIPTGQTTGSASVDLTTLYDTTGNVGSFTYKVNGTSVTSPWDSTAYGTSGPETVTLEVTGTDPDCGGSTIVARNDIDIDNTCTRVDPTISFDNDVDYAAAGETIEYTVAIYNNDSLNCSSQTFDLSFVSDSNTTDFNTSSVVGGSGLAIAGGGSATAALRVQPKSGAAEWQENDTTVQVTSDLPHGSVSGSVKTVVFQVSPITHNSITTGSSKWGGNWGTSESGSKYGNFTCLTCHEKHAANVKWMKSTISTPDGTDWGVSGTNSLSISFTDARDGSSDWGDDDPNGDGSGRVGSDASCEVCHSITEYHRYDTNTDPDGGGALTGQTNLNHFNNRDCTDCHRHSEGFTAACDNCHGEPPLDDVLGKGGLANVPAATGSTTAGTHYKHVEVLNYPCTYCHNGYRDPGEMPKEVNGYQDINLKFDVFERVSGDVDYAAATAGNYTGQDGVSYDGVVVATGSGTLTCENIYCHGGTDNMGGTNPKWNGNITCASCHGVSASFTPPGYSHTTHVGQMGLACSICHGSSFGETGHTDGKVHIDVSGMPAEYGGSSVRYHGVQSWDSTTLAPSSAYGGYGTCSNVACHYNTETPAWNNGGNPATCTICHNDGTDSGNLADAAPNTGQHAAHMDPARPLAPTYVNKCESCHGAGANTAGHDGHIDFTTDFSVGFDYTAPNCTNYCHGPTSLNDWSVADLACHACHQSPYLGPAVVFPSGTGAPDSANNPYGSHLKALKTDDLSALDDAGWDAQCRKCHPYHSGGVTVPLPSTAWDNPGTGAVESYNMQERLGLQFPATNGIHLGGSATSGTSEAQICWNCHDDAANNVSEWGTNNSANTGSISYDYGSLDTSNWTSAIWTSGYADFSYKSAPVQSTHAVGMASGYEGVNGVDAVANIRCSYCHDVHDMNRAVLAGTTTNESMTGKPYLRGSWYGNPYKEDGAPQAGTTYTNFSTDQYGSVPRGSKDPTQLMGGYWIDQNSGDPVSAWTPSEFGGLCEMCHGNGDGTLSSSEIDSLNYFGSQGSGWVSGYNGHANSVKGGSGGGGISARNIFNDTDRGGGSTNDYNGSMAYWGFQEPGDQNAGIRANDGDAWNEQPYVDRYWDEPCANDNNNCNGSYQVDWDDLRGMTVRGSSTGSPDDNYHTFSCSKCHNPHASRLPKLMITNCLDTKQNQWDNNYQAPTWGPTVLDDTTASNWTTAQNCHRLAGNDPMDGDDSSNGMGSGWNLVTPWTDGDANYGTTGDKAQDNTGTW